MILKGKFEMKKLVILANKYPNKYDPNVNVFTQQVAWALLDEGIKVIIICPNPINYKTYNKNLPFHSYEKNENGKKIEIYRPKYIGLGQEGKKLQKMRVNITTKLYLESVKRVINKLELKEFSILGEFLCPSGVAAACLGKKYGVKSYMQIGEATYQGDKKYGNENLKKILKNIDGIIALSGYIKDYLLKAGIVTEDKITILPSGYRRDRIVKRNKIEARKKFNLPLDKFIVGFCGSFDDRKGILRLERAIDSINDDEIVLAACGKGECMPKSNKLVWRGPINHKDLSWFYSALDVFAFPTYYEGCCTAIVEAIACGCPIISSDRSFNYEICDKSNSILIEPDDVNEMKNAIILLKNNRIKRENMIESSIQKSRDLSLDIKAKKMIKYMEL